MAQKITCFFIINLISHISSETVMFLIATDTIVFSYLEETQLGKMFLGLSFIKVRNATMEKSEGKT